MTHKFRMYEEALHSSLGDYLEVEAARRKISKTDLAERVEIGSVFALGASTLVMMAQGIAIEDFCKNAEEYDIVVDLRESPGHRKFLLVSTYTIRGTGVKLPPLE